MSLNYLVKLEILITQVLPLRFQMKKLQNLSYLNYGLQIRHIWIQLITACKNTAREGVDQENGVDQAGLRRHCSSHSSVA